MVEKGKRFKVVILVVLCLAVNFIGKLVSTSLHFPVWLDSVGTIMVAYVLGPFCGAVVGLGTNLMYAAVSQIAAAFGITNVCIGIIAGIAARKNLFRNSFRSFSLGIVLALSTTIISLPLNYLVAEGMTDNIWGDSVIRYFREMGAGRFVSCFLGEFYLELADKIISVLIVYWLVKKSRVKEWVRKISILIVVVSLLVLLPAEQADAADNSYYDSYIRTVYNSDNGIPGGEVNTIAQTRDGMLWVGTYGGLYQYDGSRFAFMSEFDSVRNANCLYTDEEGRLFIGTNDSGLSVCANHQIVNVLDKEGGLPEDSVRSIIKSSDGIYYVGTAGSLCTIMLSDGIQVSRVIPELNYVKRLAASDDGIVFAVTANGQLAVLKNEQICQIKNESDNHEIYVSVYFAEDGFLYAATSGNHVEKYRVENEELIPEAVYSCGMLNSINSLYMTENQFLFVCADNGIGYFDETKNLKMINTEDFNSSIDNMLVDYQGNLWFSSSRLGLMELSESIVEEIYPMVRLNKSVVNTVTQWGGNYYFGTDAGLDITDGKLTKSVKNELTERFENIRIRCLYTDSRNRLWIATSGQGVFEVGPDGSCKQYSTSQGLVHNKTRAVLELDNGDMAVATDQGISYIREGTLTVGVGEKEGLSTSKTLCLFEKQKRLYAGTDGGGIAVIENGVVIGTIRKTDGLSSDVILRIKETGDGSGLLVITSNGLNLIEENGTIRKLNQFPYYNNFDIIPSGNGNLWITSSAGIYIVRENALLNGEDIEYELLDFRQGLRGNLTANSWNYTDGAGNVLLCADDGVVRINMEEYDKKSMSYRITLESIVVDGVKLDVDKESENVIARDAVRIEFVPKIINFSAGNPYINIWLEGFDPEPEIMPQSELESKAYTNLPFGDYVFHLAVLDSRQKNIVEEITYSFRKEKAFHDNWWFGFYIFLVLGILTLYLAWLVIGSQIDKNIKIQKKEYENLKLKQAADAAMAAGEAKDKFLALMSHDIRTPINAILGMNEMILRESSDQKINEYAGDIKSAGNTLLSLVNMILDFSKIEDGKMEIVPAEYKTKDLIRNLINGIRIQTQEKGLEFRILVDAGLPDVLYGDDLRIHQIISNLLTNAMKYTQKGYISLVVREEERHDDVILLYVEVSDSGIGIKEEDMDKLFESFRRLDEEKNRNIEGTGLGMSIVSKLLKLMDSNLEVESTYGVGSKFYFRLEQKIVSADGMGHLVDAEQNEERQVEKTHLQYPKASVLVVDDNAINRKVAQALLKTNGIVPDTACSGEEAIGYVRGKKYDLILMDHMMPEMDGIETLEKLRAEQLLSDDTKIIVLTANAISGAKEQYIRAGFDDYLSKPIIVEELENLLEKYLFRQ